MARKRKRNTTPRYGIFRGINYAVPVYDLDGNVASYETREQAQAALPALQDDENRMAVRWGYPAATLTIHVIF